MEATTQTKIPLDAVVGTVQQSLDQLFRASHPHIVFGEPLEYGETKIIPCAEITMNLGFGGGGGSGSATEAQGESSSASAAPDGKQSPTKSLGGGLGMGGGGFVKSRPVAIIIMTPRGVRVQPIVDVTKVIVVGITTGGMALFSLRFLLRSVLRKR